MRIINLNKKQISEIEDKFDAFDESHIHYKMEGRILIGIEEDGEVVAGLDACFTTFKIMYVSTMFVDERYRRKGYVWRTGIAFFVSEGYTAYRTDRGENTKLLAMQGFEENTDVFPSAFREACGPPSAMPV